jgi:acyl carrier protein
MENKTIITSYLVREFLPDIRTDELESDYDLLAGGVIDSLALLRVVDWITTEFDLSIDELDLSPDNFRSVDDISALVSSAKS